MTMRMLSKARRLCLMTVCFFIIIFTCSAYRTEAATVYNTSIVSYAEQFLGYPYGHAYGPSVFDCSGLVKYVFEHFGISLPWSSASFWESPSNYGTVVAESNALPGDVVSWSGHMGIYIGNGEVINALNYSTGVVKTKISSFLDANGNSNPPHRYIRIYGVTYTNNTDTTSPAYSNFHVGEFWAGGFTVMSKITDPSGIQSVKYAIWTENNGQDDIIWYDGYCTDNNDVYWSRVEFANHKNEKGMYTIHMYAYDNLGNLTNVGISYIFPDKGPTISNIKVSDYNSSGYTITCQVKHSAEISRVQFPTWTTANGQDDIAQNWDTNTKVRGQLKNGTATFRVNISEHGNETGIYRTHIYAYDIFGNKTSVAVPDVDFHKVLEEIESSSGGSTEPGQGTQPGNSQPAPSDPSEPVPAPPENPSPAVPNPSTGSEKETPETEVNEEEAPTAAEAEETIISQKTDYDAEGSNYSLLQAKMKKANKTSITLTWKAVKGATSYRVYGNKCGKKNKYKKLKTLKKTTFTQKKLKKGTYYKYIVIAIKDGKAIAISKTIHIATTGGKVGNPKSVKLKKKSYSVKVEKTVKIKASEVPASTKLKVKKHRAIAFESSNSNIATVSGKGVVKGIRKGICYIYTYAQNGVMGKVKVTVG